MSFGDISRGFSEWSLGGIDLTLDDFDRIGSHVPLLVDLPAGRFLMDDFTVPADCSRFLREVRDLLDPTVVTVTGRPLVDYLDAALSSGTLRSSGFGASPC
jgi:dihydroxyacid dehydratase/phosphogluconate dehydratase